MPEKYLTPASSLWLQSDSSFSVIEAGAPRPAWNVTSHGPLTLIVTVPRVSATGTEANYL